MARNAVIIGAGRIGSALAAHLDFRVTMPTHEKLDVTDSYAVMKFFDSVGEVDLLIYTAGAWGYVDKVRHSHPHLWQKAFQVNLFGLQTCCYWGLPKMRKGGHIIAFAGGGKGPMPMRSALSCAKTVIGRFVETLAAEEPQLKVNAIAPGPAWSKMHEKVLHIDAPWVEEYKKMRDTSIGEVPLEWTLNTVDHILKSEPTGQLFFARDFWPRPKVSYGG